MDRIPLIIGKGLTAKAREALGMDAGDIFITPAQPEDDGKGYTLAQKMVGKACGMEGSRQVSTVTDSYNCGESGYHWSNDPR